MVPNLQWSLPMSREPQDDEGSPGDGWAVAPARRQFLQQMGGAAMGALVMIGIPPGLAATVTPTVVRSLRRNGNNPAYPLPKADEVQIDKENQVILVRWADKVYAFNRSCPHQNTALRWNSSDAQFQCPKHHSRYKPDGEFISGRATRSMDRFSLSRSGGEVTVDLAQLHKDDVDHHGWLGAVITL
jgi:Rieske Fe-S protein